MVFHFGPTYYLNLNKALFTMLFLNDDDNHEYSVACKEISKHLNERFKVDNPIIEYFDNLYFIKVNNYFIGNKHAFFYIQLN
jgi:hypothetical protein